MKFKNSYLCCAIILMLNPSSYAKQLGQLGDVWGIQEQNLLTLIENRLHERLDGKSEQEMQAEIMKQVTESALRPQGVQLPRALENRVRSFDPSYTVTQDLADHKGLVFAKKGKVVNPFSLYRFSQTLIFIDGDDAEQVKWAKQFKAETEDRKLILVNGNVKEAGELLDEQIYFDQQAALIQRFGIEKLPTVIDEWQGKDLLRIREFALK